jgi:hypothetical protein
MSPIQPYQQRVLDEQSELGGRLERLGRFMWTPEFDQLARDEQMRLARQQQAMKLYYDCLQDRINAFMRSFMPCRTESAPQPQVPGAPQ